MLLHYELIDWLQVTKFFWRFSVAANNFKLLCLSRKITTFQACLSSIAIDHSIHCKMKEVSIKRLTHFLLLKTVQCTNFVCDWSQFFKPTVAIYISAKLKQSFMPTTLVTPPSTQLIKKCKVCDNPQF